MKKIFLFPVLCFLIILYSTIACAADSLIHPDKIEFPPLKFEPPQAHQIALKNGIVLYIIEDHEIPLVRMTAVFRAGSNYDPPGKPGVADLTAALLRTGGTASMSGDAVDREIDFRAAEISFSANMEACIATLSMQRDDMQNVMQLFSAMIRTPAFEQAKLSTAQGLTTESLARINDFPLRLASREFLKLIYANNPRGNLPTIRSIQTISRDDLITFHHRFFFPKNLRIAISGDLNDREAIDLVSKYLGDWEEASPSSSERSATEPLPDIPLPSIVTKDKLYLLPKQSPQSAVMIGYILPGKGNPDFYALSVLDFVLGSGGFRSRIMQEVRTVRGLAYSAGSQYSARANFGMLQLYSLTKPSSTAEVTSLMKNILRDLRNLPITEEDLNWAKRSLTNHFIFSMENPDQIAYRRLMLDFDGLPADFLVRYPDKIARVTIQDVQRVARQHLAQEHALTFILGDDAKFSTLSGIGEATRIEGKN